MNDLCGTYASLWPYEKDTSPMPSTTIRIVDGNDDDNDDKVVVDKELCTVIPTKAAANLHWVSGLRTYRVASDVSSPLLFVGYAQTRRLVTCLLRYSLCSAPMPGHLRSCKVVTI